MLVFVLCKAHCIAILRKGRLSGGGTVLCAVHHLWARIRCLFDVHAAHFRDRLCAVLGSGGQRFHYVHCDLAAEQASAQHFAGRCGADRAGDFGSRLGI